MKDVFYNANYVGATIDQEGKKNPKKREGVVRSHLFEIHLCGEVSTIIVQEMEWGEFFLHSISDSKIPIKNREF